MTERPPSPALTVDLIIQIDQDIVLIERRFPPHGWALPGGFLDPGESLAEAAIREAKEETGLDVVLIEQFHTYSKPTRDPRRHTVSTVFIAYSNGIPVAGDDAGKVMLYCPASRPSRRNSYTKNEVPVMAFDHGTIIEDYVDFLMTGCRPPAEH